MYNKRSIAIHYLKSTFFVDLIALVPYFMQLYLYMIGKETSMDEGLWRVYYLKVVRLIFKSSKNNSLDLIFGG